MLFAAGGLFAPAPPEIFGVLEPAGPVLTTVGLPVILSMINFVPTPSAAPVTAFTTLLAVELGLVTVGLTVGFTTDVGDVVLVVGVVVVLVVTAGFVAGVVTLVVGVVVLDVIVGLVVKGTFGASVVFGMVLGFVTAGLDVGEVTVEVIGGRVAPPPVVVAPAVKLGRAPDASEVMEPELRPVNEGRSLNSRMTLSRGARSSPLASGIFLLDVRFFRIAMF